MSLTLHRVFSFDSFAMTRLCHYRTILIAGRVCVPQSQFAEFNAALPSTMHKPSQFTRWAQLHDRPWHKLSTHYKISDQIQVTNIFPGLSCFCRPVICFKCLIFTSRRGTTNHFSSQSITVLSQLLSIVALFPFLSVFTFLNFSVRTNYQEHFISSH